MTSKVTRWTGRVISAIPVLFMGVLAIVFLFAKPEMVAEGANKYGYPPGAAKPMIIAEICCAILYAIPRTAALGAILLTGYLGGAVATHVHAGELFIFPVVMGVVVWLGLWFRDGRVRELVPLRKCTRA
jgi:hypothetical protein